MILHRPAPVYGGQGRIRTSELLREQIYSLSPLTTRPPALEGHLEDGNSQRASKYMPAFQRVKGLFLLLQPLTFGLSGARPAMAATSRPHRFCRARCIDI